MSTKTNELTGTLPREMMQHAYPILYAVGMTISPACARCVASCAAAAGC